MLMPGTACAKRLLKAVKQKNSHLDLSFGRITKCLLLLEDGKLVSCALTPKTIAVRVGAAQGNDINEGEDENEDSGTSAENIDAE